MLKHIKSLKQSKFVRNVLLVATGTAGAQAIGMAFSPVITRMYGPEAFGLLGAFMATLGIVTPIAALAYPVAIVLPKSDGDAKGIAKLSFRIALVIAVVLGIIFLLAGDKIAAWLGMQAIAGFMLFIPLAMFFSALQQIMQQWLIRKKQFKITARIAVSQSLILNSAKVGVGVFNPIGAILIVLATLGNALYALQLWFGAKRWMDENSYIGIEETKKNSLKSLAYQHRDFPYYRAPQMLINAISQSLPTLLLVSLFSPLVAGYFTLTRSVLAAPATLIGSSVGNVFYPKVTEKVNKGEDPTGLLLKSTLIISFLISVPFSIVILLGPWIFKIIFGEQWAISGEYAQWMAVWLITSVAARPTIALIPVLNIQRFFLIFEILFTVLKLSALFVGGLYYSSPLVAIALYSITSCLFYIVLFLFVLSKCRQNQFLDV